MYFAFSYLPLKKDVNHYLYKLNFLHPMMLCAKFARWFWRRRFLKLYSFLLFLTYFPFWKVCGPSFEQTWIPFNQWCIVPSLVKIDPAVLEKKMKMWKVYAYNNDNDDGDGQRTNADQKCSLEPKAQVN